MNNDNAKDAAEPCPFCGTIDKFGPNKGVGLCAMKCQKCGARGPISPNYKEATAAWNTRATAADKERIAGLETLLRNEAALVDEIRDKLFEKTQECEGLREDKAEAEAHAYDAGAEWAREGVQEVFLNPDKDDTELDGMKPVCRITFYKDRGEPDIGIDGWWAWVLAEDQSGTTLQQLIDSARKEGE